MQILLKFLIREEKLYTNGRLELLYVRVLINLWPFLFAARPKEFFFGWVKEVKTTKLYNCVELRGNM
jgi:hypothetical protein